jgi:hypothetical protein
MVENRFLTRLTTITSYSTCKYVPWANRLCSIILWYHPRCLLHLWPKVITQWATIATDLWATWLKMVENRLLTILSSLTSYFTHKYVLWANKWCSIILWYHPRWLQTLVTPYSYPKGNHSHSFVSKNGRKKFNAGLWWYLPQYNILVYRIRDYGGK